MTDDHAFPDRDHAAERYLLGEMSDAERDRFEEHFFACADCAEDVRTTAAFLNDVRTYAAPGVSTRPAAPVASLVSTRATWYRSPAIPWAMAASFLVFAVYQSLVLVPGLRKPGAPRELHPITLRPDSRGQEPVVVTGAASDVVTLAIEINDVEEGTPMEFTIATVDGRHPTSGQLTAPRAGLPLLLLLPSSALEEPARYELSIRLPGTGRLLGSYRFTRSQ